MLQWGSLGTRSLYWGKKNRLLICAYLRLFLFNHGFISCSGSLILYFSFWQVDQEAVAKSFIVCGILATLGSMAMRESSLATLVTFYPGCSSLKSHSCWLPCTPPSGFVLRMSQWPACRWHPAIDAGTDSQTLCSRYWFSPLFVDNNSCFELSLSLLSPAFPMHCPPLESLRFTDERKKPFVSWPIPGFLFGLSPTTSIKSTVDPGKLLPHSRCLQARVPSPIIPATCHSQAQLSLPSLLLNLLNIKAVRFYQSQPLYSATPETTNL